MSPSRPRWLPSYLLLALIWGCSFLFIKVGLESLTPAGVAFSRIVLGLITLLVLSAFMRSPLPPRRAWGPLFVAALLMTSVPWTLFAYAEQHVSSALAGIINGATPLMTLVAILLVFPEERPTRQRVVGLVVGFAGVLVVVGIWQGLGTGTWLGIGACLLAITGYGFSFPYVRRHLATGDSPVGAMTLATGLLAMGAIQSAPIVLVTGYSHAAFTVSTALALLALGCLGSGFAYVLNFRVISRSDATTASTVTYVITLVAVLAGALFLGEHITWNQPVGGALVLLGAAVAQGLVRLDRRG